jgi:hypothetical protein
MCSKKKNIALLRSLDNVSNIGSINIRSLRDYKSRAVNTQLPRYCPPASLLRRRTVARL